MNVLGVPGGHAGVPGVPTGPPVDAPPVGGQEEAEKIFLLVLELTNPEQVCLRRRCLLPGAASAPARDGASRAAEGLVAEDSSRKGW